MVSKLILILIVAALFRLVGLTSAPPGLNWDEVSIGYNAYSILKTGRDEWGEFLPLTFKAFGENKLPGMIYASVPGIALFGTTDFGVRVTPALLGILAVYLVFILAKELLGDKKIALAAAALMAISPWAVHFSRVSFEAGLALVLTLIALICLARANTQPRYLWGAMVAAVLAAYTYNSVRILLPALLLTYLATRVIKVSAIGKKTLLSVLLTGLLLCTPIFLELASPTGRVRFGTVSLSAHQGFIDNIGESRGYTKLPSPLPQLIHNKYTHYGYTLFMNYLKTFSTEFLLFKGSSNSQRSVQGMGLLYLFELPLLIIGITKLARYKTGQKIILPLLLLAPLPSALTIDAPSSVRALAMLPALIMIESLGFVALAAYLKKYSLAKVLVGLFMLWNILYFCYQLWYVNPVKYSDKWLYGYKQAVAFIASHYPQMDKIYLTARYGEPHIYVLFYTGYDPHKFQTEKVERETDPTGWVHVKSFDKYIFSDFSGLESPEEIVARNHGKLLMVTAFAQLPAGYTPEVTIKAPNWKIMFEGTIMDGKL